MRLKIGAAILAATMGLMASASASAEIYQFTLNGPYAAVWTIDSSPAPDEVGADSFFLHDVAGNYSAIPGNTGTVNYLADIEFYTSSVDGGFYLGNFYDSKDLLTTNGAQLFTGTTAAATFKLGSFLLTNASNVAIQHSLTISTIAAAVPEPASWAFMITGFGMVGGTLRVRKSAKPKVLATA